MKKKLLKISLYAAILGIGLTLKAKPAAATICDLVLHCDDADSCWVEVIKCDGTNGDEE